MYCNVRKAAGRELNRLVDAFAFFCYNIKKLSSFINKNIMIRVIIDNQDPDSGLDKGSQKPSEGSLSAEQIREHACTIYKNFILEGGYEDRVRYIRRSRTYREAKKCWLVPLARDTKGVRYNPVDLVRLSAELRKIEEENYKPWVAEAGVVREEEGEVTEDEMLKLIEAYKQIKADHDKWASHRPYYEEGGTGRDLLCFAFGQTVMGHSPVDMTASFKKMSPADFRRLLMEADKKLFGK